MRRRLKNKLLVQYRDGSDRLVGLNHLLQRTFSWKVSMSALNSLILRGWLLCIAALFVTGSARSADPPTQGKIPALTEIVAAGNDVWGEMAMRQPNGPSYEFFEPLLPPPRYVHADF